MEPFGYKNEEGKDILRWPEEGEYTPMLLAIARPDYLKQAFEKVDNLRKTDEAGASSNELDYSDDDLQFFDELSVDTQKAAWNSLEMQGQLKQLVIQEDPSKVDPYAKKQPRPKGFSPEERQEFIDESNYFGPPSRRKSPQFVVDDDIEEVLKTGQLKDG